VADPNDALVAYCDLAYQMGIEAGEGMIAGQPASIRHRVTNIYRREADGWKIVHRHTEVNPGECAVSRLLNTAGG
jgi:ketosteroid isomerase-like protein